MCFIINGFNLNHLFKVASGRFQNYSYYITFTVDKYFVGYRLKLCKYSISLLIFNYQLEHPSVNLAVIVISVVFA